ncbi:Ubiquitin conjugating enzyme E2 [Tubulinosema ratisbonensis]|uniref:Ubiquitin conjugating enzyme E2 n=1 Tax=Tubulinosema ratisbonensis TaxID=291195 RepID=A0A437AKS1_9MICR|nr:Ubiquitin conjugating enzyme E2 [Tubulinosema ratisbonensis]
MSTFSERLLAELKSLRKKRGYKFYAYPEEKNGTLNLKTWHCGFPGTDIYGGGYFKLKLFFKDDYPFKPPVAQFDYNVFHPNIYDNGVVCLDLLSSKWKPQLSIYSILYALQNLLNNPNPHSPSNSKANSAFLGDKEIYKQKVKENIKKYHNKNWYKQI